MSMLTLFVMTEKGLTFLEQAAANFKEIIAEVVIGQDKSVDNDYSLEISRACEYLNIKFRFRTDFSEIKTEYAMAVSWRWLIKHPPEKLIVFHDSLLPKYRGFAPLVNALINGESTIGVSAIFGASEYDRGDIICQSSARISYPITISEAIKLVGECYIHAGKTVIQAISRGQDLNAEPQNHEQATYSLWRDEEDYHIDWNQSAVRIRRTIDAVGSPFKGAYCLVDGVPARILAAEEIPDVQIENRTPGKVIFIYGGMPVVVCGTGLLRIVECINASSRESMLPMSKIRVRFA